MCKNVFWQCIFCDTALHHSTTPQLCHYARVSGYECIPLEQEQWPIPSYALCTSCREKMQSRRHHGGRDHRHRTRTGSLPLLVEEPQSVTRPGEEQFQDEDAVIHSDEGHYHDVKEGYIWEWIPTPTAASFASPSVSESSCDDWHFSECEMYDDASGDGDGWRSRISTATSSSTTTTNNNTEEQERIEESESTFSSCSNSPLESSYRSSTHRHRSFIPVLVRERPLRDVICTGGRLRSNIPVASSRITGGKQQRQSPDVMSSVFDGSEGELHDGGGIAGPDDVDWEYFDQITF